MKKIFLCADFIMTKETEQLSNRRWVVDLLTRPIFKSTSIRPVSFFSSLVDTEKFSRIKFFELSNIHLNIEKTQFMFDSNLISEASLEYLKSFLDIHTLVIGFELSKETRFILNKIGVTYIDFWLHPVRFLDDLLFSFYSNNEHIYTQLMQFEIDEEYFYNYGTKIKIQTYKGWRRSNLPILENSAVFFGQTLNDKAIMKNGKMLTILDFKEEIEDILQKYNILYYVRHPYVNKGDEDILKYIKNHPKMKLVNYPSYDLLSNNNIQEVISISSSLVHEAKYFEKKNRFLYKPILNFGTDFFNNEYIPIYQDFISIHFWSKILSPILKTTSYKKITYLDEKDKIRDMLNFYWSYKQIDKLENMRSILNKINKTSFISNRTKKYNLPKIKYGKSRKDSLDVIFSKIDKHSIISFDIFDTLLTRPFYEPNDIFRFMEYEVYKKFYLKDFFKLRTEARSLVQVNNSEEINLEERYKAMSKHIGLNFKEIKKIKSLELKYEKKFLEVRRFVYDIYQYALASKKKIIITSDTFYSREFIEEVLFENDIQTYNEIFLSSEYGLLKHSGNLFKVIKKSLNVNGNKILHIGDNKHSDILMSKRFGIDSVYIKSVKEDFLQKSKLFDYISYKSKILESITKGIIAKNLSDTPDDFDTPSLVNGKPYNLGIGIIGPIFSNFVKSLIEKSIEDGIDILFFLSRDGHIIKKVYDIFSPLYENAPKSKYLYASRRSISVASINTIFDVYNILDRKFNICTVYELFNNRFGIEIPETLIKKAGFYNSLSKVEYNKDIQKLKELASLSFDIILENALIEKELLLNYYNKNELLKSDKKIGIVDIGHEGSLQNGIFRLTNIKIYGYYFATFPDIKKNVENFDMKSWGYLGNKISDNSNFYKKNILMFENLFLNIEGSFIRIDKDTNNFIKLSTLGESERIAFSLALHNGIIDFNIQLKKVLNKEFVYIEREEIYNILNPYIQFLNNPSYVDLKMFVNISFENSYNCKNMEYLIFINNRGIAEINKSIWKKGAEVYNAYRLVKRKKIKLLTEKQNKLLNKFVDNPYKFFTDSKYSFLRYIGKLIY